MHWATLPPSGRLPLDNPPTLFDPWPVDIQCGIFAHLQLEAGYPLEQSRLYPTKRALMLVSRAWADLAVEFMYESLVLDRFGVGRPEQVLATLRDSALLKKWVRRIDIWNNHAEKGDNLCARLVHLELPNLRVQYYFGPENILRPLPILLSKQPLYHVECLVLFV